LRLLVAFALEQEFGPWRKLRKFQRLADSDVPVFRTSLDETDLCVVLTGMGRTATRRAMEHVFNPRPDVCISAGVAGGLQLEQSIAEVLIARRIQELSSQRILESDPALVDLAMRAGGRPVGSFCTSHYAVIGAESKRRMGRMSDAVEMEAYHILEAAAQHGVRGIAVRALSDLVGEDLPFDFSAMINEHGTVDYGRLAGRLARWPQRIPALLRLASNTRKAARALVHFLDAYVIALRQSNAEMAAMRTSAKVVVA
jgi:nucleoside phosphorylase